MKTNSETAGGEEKKAKVPRISRKLLLAGNHSCQWRNGASIQNEEEGDRFHLPATHIVQL